MYWLSWRAFFVSHPWYLSRKVSEYYLSSPKGRTLPNKAGYSSLCHFFSQVRACALLATSFEIRKMSIGVISSGCHSRQHFSFCIWNTYTFTGAGSPCGVSVSLVPIIFISQHQVLFHFTTNTRLCNLIFPLRALSTSSSKSFPSIF